MDVDRMKPRILLTLSAVVLLGAVRLATAGAAESSHGEHDNGVAIGWFSIVKPVGIAALSSVCLTFLTGLFRRKLGRRFRRIHVTLATIAVILGLSHGLLVFVLFG